MKHHHVGLYVTNLAKSAQFYEYYFEFKPVKRLTLLGEEIIFIARERVIIELIQSEEQQGPFHHTFHFALEVSNLDKWIQNLTSKGLEIAEGPYDLETGWKIAFYQALDGEVIELIERFDQDRFDK
ncbi:VOC family protein [Bacillus salitolerans]|uniref:VOC family protein n=1 Tax=Bacillus salitolerans TaxID=1437434 RepID=A0ABW4LSQ1_9BACI